MNGIFLSNTPTKLLNCNGKTVEWSPWIRHLDLFKLTRSPEFRTAHSRRTSCAVAELETDVPVVKSAASQLRSLTVAEPPVSAARLSHHASNRRSFNCSNARERIFYRTKVVSQSTSVSYFTTKLTILPGTTIALTNCLPLSHSASFS